MNIPKKISSDGIALVFFCFSIAFTLFGYGVAVGTYQIFPYKYLQLAKQALVELNSDNLPWFYTKVNETYLPPVVNTGRAYRGINLVTRIAGSMKLSAEILDMNGQKIHEWDVDWTKIWPNPVHVPDQFVPKSKPGTHIHGAVVMPNGDLVFNFEHLGMARLDRNGRVVWRLPYRTHHSIHVHNDGNFWVCGQTMSMTKDPYFPYREPPFDKYTILQVTPEGKILKEWFVSDLLRKNGYAGLLHLGTAIGDWNAFDDRLHLNDAEPFPLDLKEGFFKKGDVLVSLRHVNTIFVFNQFDEKVKYISTGMFIHQHDPDFLDGNTFSVFDNKHAPGDGYLFSRIVVVSVPDNKMRVFYEGSLKQPFYTDKLGKHQWLPNGNLLITESMMGRAFEINPAGEIVWQYVNYASKGIVGLLEEVQRLPLDYAGFIGSQ